jgi:hypothetical protein
MPELIEVFMRLALVIGWTAIIFGTVVAVYAVTFPIVGKVRLLMDRVNRRGHNL